MNVLQKASSVYADHDLLQRMSQDVLVTVISTKNKNKTSQFLDKEKYSILIPVSGVHCKYIRKMTLGKKMSASPSRIKLR